MAKVEIVHEGRAAGIWISSDRGMMGIVAQDGQAPYIQFSSSAELSNPEACIYLGEDKKLVAQIGDAGHQSEVSLVQLGAILEMIHAGTLTARVIPPPPPPQ